MMNIGRAYMKSVEFLSRQLKLELIRDVQRVGIDPLGVARAAVARAIRGIDRVAGVQGPERAACILRDVFVPFFGKADTARIGAILAGVCKS
ncbi:hypothetical protein [Azoarcus sp. DD4]|uniref:hypothetical protein n=1 Tax=Azoarcus sp. DD4 TaxID=2027405 RepID=UPI00143D2DA8|nr:hypothetical protein [Azoarcus sp. DD4]